MPDLHDDWPLLRAALDSLDIEARTAVWNDPAVDWSTFDLVVANGAWDNIHHAAEFCDWADRVAADIGVPLVNSPATLRWNIDKRYLRDLAADGVPTLPTAWVEAGGDDGRQALGRWPDTEIVVKPSVSGGGFRTARYEPSESAAAHAHVAELGASGRTAMVQPYVESVDQRGEVGLVFLGGTFSHALHKGPMLHRGTGPLDDLIDNMAISPATASDAQLRVARQALDAAEERFGPMTYARADLVELDSGPSVLELELLDPNLFFAAADPQGAPRFAAVLAKLVATS